MITPLPKKWSSQSRGVVPIKIGNQRVEKFSIGMLVFFIFLTSCVDSTKTDENQVKISLAGHLSDSRQSLAGVTISYASTLDSGMVSSDSTGHYEISLFEKTEYDISWYSLMHQDTNQLITCSTDTTIDMSLVEIDYYPSSIGSYWKYEYRYTRWDDPPYDSFIDLIYERTIVDSSATSIGSMLTVVGRSKGFGMEDTIEINQTQYFQEVIDSNFEITSFLAVPFADTSRSITLNKYLHEGYNTYRTNLSLQSPSPWSHQIYQAGSYPYSGTIGLTSTILFNALDGEVWLKNNVGVLYIDIYHFATVVQEEFRVRLIEHTP